MYDPTIEQVSAGLPRPRWDGRPVPYVTPLGPDGPQWQELITDRVAACQEGWLCQVCGKPLPQEAIVIVNRTGRVLTDSALHSGACLTMAFRFCPYLAGNPEVRAVEVTPADITQSNYVWHVRDAGTEENS